MPRATPVAKTWRLTRRCSRRRSPRAALFCDYIVGILPPSPSVAISQSTESFAMVLHGSVGRLAVKRYGTSMSSLTRRLLPLRCSAHSERRIERFMSVWRRRSDQWALTPSLHPAARPSGRAAVQCPASRCPPGERSSCRVASSSAPRRFENATRFFSMDRFCWAAHKGSFPTGGAKRRWPGFWGVGSRLTRSRRR